MCCMSALTKLEIANGEAFENPARVLGCAASECMSRPSGRLQLAPAGHVRSIVNSVPERGRACARNARESCLSDAKAASCLQAVSYAKAFRGA